MTKKISFKKDRKKNNLVSVRINDETMYCLDQATQRTGMTRPAFIRLAIIEKNERDKKCK